MGRGRRGARLLVVCGLAAIAAPPAMADPGWLVTLEAPGAIPVAEPQSSRFGPGGMPAAGVYRSFNRWLLLGLRVRGGALTDGDAPKDMSIADPGSGGLLSLGLGVRLRPLASDTSRRGTGMWIDLAGGGAITGGDTRGTFEAGIGWGFEVGSINVGPSARYLYVDQTANVIDDRGAHIALVGVELSLFDGGETLRAHLPRVARKPDPVSKPDPEPVDSDGDGIFDDKDKCPKEPEDKDGFADEDGCPDPDNDEDGIADVDDECPIEPEVVNGIDDKDGCPDEGLIVVVKDRVILEETVLFDVRRARVKHAAKPVMRALVELARQHPEWERVIIEGHADTRGRADYNQFLSDLRAQRVRKSLIKHGFPASKIEAKGYGSTRPRDPGNTDEAHQRNRRVEFVIIKSRKETRGVRTDKATKNDGDGDGDDGGGSGDGNDSDDGGDKP